jgi:PAS domain-containing protein
VLYYLIAAQKYQQGTGTVSVGIDITEHKQVEEALRIAEENYRSIYENALEGIFQSTPEGTYISVNPAMARIYGYDSPKDMVANAKKQNLSASWQSYRWRLISKSGSERWQRLPKATTSKTYKQKLNTFR